MSIEGMGRRRPKKDIAKEIEHGEADFAFEQHQRDAAALIEFARPIDKQDKALTGRKIESYVSESGIAQNELFPEDGTILNIGDPWQTVDRAGITNLEYETGEEASFLTNTDFFFERLGVQLDAIEDEIQYFEHVKPEVAQSIRWKVHAIREFQEEGTSVFDYPKSARVAEEIARELAELVPEVYDRYPNAWYTAIHIARGFSDIHLEETVIQPMLDREAMKRKRKSLSEEEQNELRRQIIEKQRGKKKYRESELVKGAFPHTHFDDGAFDRITASWSISAHMFGVMNAKQFATTWAETDRLLRPDGAAYFWPMNYYFDDPQALLESIQTYTGEGGMVGVILFHDLGQAGQLVWCNANTIATIEQHWPDVLTLVVLSRRHNATTVKRVESSLCDQNAAATQPTHAA